MFWSHECLSEVVSVNSFITTLSINVTVDRMKTVITRIESTPFTLDPHSEDSEYVKRLRAYDTNPDQIRLTGLSLFSSAEGKTGLTTRREAVCIGSRVNLAHVTSLANYNRRWISDIRLDGSAALVKILFVDFLKLFQRPRDSCAAPWNFFFFL